MKVHFYSISSISRIRFIQETDIDKQGETGTLVWAVLLKDVLYQYASAQSRLQ